MSDCVISEQTFRVGCDAVVGELRNAWTALDRAQKKVDVTLRRWDDDHCRAHGGTIDQMHLEIGRIRRQVEKLEVEIRQAGTPALPSPL